MPLTLTRKLGETILIGDKIAVTVTHLDVGKVRLTVDAPLDVEIWRPELLAKDDPRLDNVPRS